MNIAFDMFQEGSSDITNHLQKLADQASEFVSMSIGELLALYGDVSLYGNNIVEHVLDPVAVAAVSARRQSSTNPDIIAICFKDFARVAPLIAACGRSEEDFL